MGISNLASGDTFVVYTEEASNWSDNQSVTATGATITGTVQTLSAEEAVAFGFEGMRRGVQIFCSTDPSIDEDSFLQHTARADGSSVTPRWFRVQAVMEEGRPGETNLWIILAEQLTAAGVPDVN
jgi:hypothetical protein